MNSAISGLCSSSLVYSTSETKLIHFPFSSHAVKFLFEKEDYVERDY